MSRKVWVTLYDKGVILYPNLYIFLIGAPASGKSIAIDVARNELWKEMKDYFVAPKSITAAALSDTLNEAKIKLLRPGLNPPFIEFNSLIICSSELGVFISAYDGEFIQRLTDLYDNGIYDERRRGKDLKIVIPQAQLNLLGGTTPSYLNDLLPSGAWDQGFISRVIMIYSSEVPKKKLFGASTEETVSRQVLVEDLKTIGSLYGQMTWQPAAADLLELWNEQGGPPTPDHIRLIHYTGRRTSHLAKLCMIASVSRSNELIITEDDFHEAVNWLAEAEFYMPEIFKSMKSNTADGTAIDEAFYFVWAEWSKSKKPVGEHQIIQFLQQRVPNYSVLRIIDLMCRSNMLKQVGANGHGGLYEPVAKSQHSSQ